MPSGTMPTYDYRPTVSGVPRIKTRSAFRSRLFAGGTYFRSKEVGANWNNLDLICESIDDGAYLVVHNKNVLLKEMLVGNVNVLSLDFKLQWNEIFRVEKVNDEWRARIYSISIKIAPGETLKEDLGSFEFDGLFVRPGKIAIKSQLVQQASELVAFELRPRIEVFELLEKVVTVESNGNAGTTTSETFSGWDIDDLRSKASDSKWIEMPIRGSDPQDNGEDDVVFALFQQSSMRGGDGLPENPIGLETGPIRSLIFINYAEEASGKVGVRNTIYEWVGSSNILGEWKPY